MASFLDGWEKCSIPVLPLEDERVNMLVKYGIELDAIAGCALPLGSLKLPGVEGLLSAARAYGAYREGDDVIEATSGRTGSYLVRLAKKYGLRKVILVMKRDVPRAKSDGPLIAGATIISPDLDAEFRQISPIKTARNRGGGGWTEKGWQRNGKLFNLDQYAAPYLKDNYANWAVPKILDAAGEFEVLVVPVGTGGTVVGLSEGFKARFGESMFIVGVLCADDNEIPGMRDAKGMADVKHPWRAACDYVEYVERRPAFLCAPWLDWSVDVPGGPSGGATYVAACRFGRRLAEDPKFAELQHRLRGKRGNIRIRFVVHDDIGPYVADRFTTDYHLDNFNPSTAHPPTTLIFGATV